MAEKASCSQPTELDAVPEKGVENSAASTSDTDPKSAIDQFLEMQRRERNSEIKNLREDSKVVTVGKRRQRINHFLLRVIHGEDVPSDSESTKSDETNQSSSADEQQQTPARVEIRGLFDQRPVSSVLQSNQFRRQLENIIRGNVIRQERELETNLRLRNAGLSVAAGGAPLTESSVSSHSVEDVRSESSSISHTSGHDFPPPPLSMLNSSQEPQMGHSVPPPPPVPQQFLPSRTNQHPVTHPQPSSVYSQQQLGTYQQPPWIYQHSPVAHQQQPVMYQQQPGVYQQPRWVYQQPAGANYQQTPWFFQQQPQVYQGHSPVYQRPIIHQPQQFGRHQYPQAHQQSPLPLPAVVNQQSSVANQPQPYLTQQPGADDIFVEHHREQIIADITELVHNQLVTQTLESNFRGTLEVMMQNRLSQSGTDGERVMNVVQNLPRSDSYRRNDFSHLGIFAAPVEGTEAATAMPLGAVGPWGQEMSALKAQMQELQNMVRLSFDLQLDLQRAIRQEVAAALSGQTRQVSNSSCANEGHTNHPANEGNCLICLDKGVDSVLYQCGHMCVCLSCGLRLKSMNAHCPICRAPIRDVIRAYRSQRD